MNKWGCLIAFLVLLVAGLLIAALFGAGGLVMLLWNFVIHSGLHGPQITVWDGTGFVFLLVVLMIYLGLGPFRRRRK